MTKHILFVEKEVNIRQGLQSNLQSMRDEWEMTFVETGQAALEYIASYDVDVLVFDISMPEMDAAQLLKSLRKQQPGIIRMGLSGQLREASQQSSAESQDPDLLISMIRRSTNMQKYLRDPALCDFVSGIPSLPDMPVIYKTFIDELSNPASTIETVAETIEQDAALASSIKKLANSDYFDVPENVSGIPQIIESLGLETMGSLIAYASLFAEFAAMPEQIEWVENLGSRSAMIGALSRDIARLEGLDSHDVDRACCAGMLLHIGTLVLISSYPEGYVRIGEMIETKGLNINEAEQQEFSASHADIGAYLLGLWGFSDPVVEAVLHHHAPAAKIADTFSPASAAHVAQGLSRLIDGDAGINFSDDDMVAALDMDHLRHIGRSDRLPVWRKHIEEIIRKNSTS